MNERAAQAAIPAVDSPSPLPSRRCRCGAAASPIGAPCPACAGSQGLGLPLGAAEGPHEHAAERLAEHAMRPPEPRRPSAAAASSGAPRPAARAGEAISRRILAMTGSGQPLPSAERAALEPRFGVDFGRTRIHTGPAAADMARALGARAFTYGRDIFMAAGQWRPSRDDGRRLLAHELGHIVQQGGADPLDRPLAGRPEAAPARRPSRVPRPLLQRAPDPAAGHAARAHYIAMEVTTDPDNREHNSFSHLDAAAPAIALGRVYPGDVLLIRVFDEDSRGYAGTLAWQLPAGLERTEATQADTVRLRVPRTTPAGTAQNLSLTDASGAQYRLQLDVGTPPAVPQAVDPGFESLREERRGLRESRREARRSFRAQERDQRRESRAARREQRKAFRAESRSLSERSRTLRQAQSCDEATQKRIQAALEQAIASTERALSRLSAADALARPELRAALLEYMRWTPGDPAAAETLRHLARILDTLRVASNSMRLALSADFACVTSCEQTTGAQVDNGSRKQGAADHGVEICPAWIQGTTLKFPVASGLDEARAYALLHEYVHKSGAFAAEKDVLYVGGDAWRAVTALEALELADGYAALAWRLGARAEGAP